VVAGGRGRLKIKVLVEGLRVVILCVVQKGADAGDVRGLGSAQERIFEKGLPKALPRLALAQRETSRDHYSNRIARRRLPHPLKSPRRGATTPSFRP
jgi:hypothetical protein